MYSHSKIYRESHFFSVRETCFHTTTRRFDNSQAALKQACRLSEGFSHVDEVTISGVYWSYLWWGPLDTGMRKADKPPQKYPIPTPSHIEFFSSEKERHSEMQNWYHRSQQGFSSSKGKLFPMPFRVWVHHALLGLSLQWADAMV